MEDNMKRELDDEQLDNVAGGADLTAWFESGRGGVPYCTEPHILEGFNFGRIPMNSYWKDGVLYVECAFCKVPKRMG